MSPSFTGRSHASPFLASLATCASTVFCLVGLLGIGACDDEQRDEVHTFAAEFDTLIVSVGSGKVELCGGDVEEIEVHATITGSKTELRSTSRGNELTLESDCHPASQCGLDLEIILPSDMAARVDTGSGDVYVHGIDGAVHADTGSGDVVGALLGGVTFHANTGSGNVVGEALWASDVEVSTGSGEVELGLLGSDLGYRVSVDTGSGDVLLHVPRGPYRLDWDTGSGELSTRGITRDGSALDRLSVDTGSGDIRVLGR